MPSNLFLAGIAGDQFMGRTQTDILFGRSADLPVPHPKSGETVYDHADAVLTE